MAASTRNLGALPNIESLRRQMQTLALLDAILESEWEYRYFSFNCRWSNTEQMGSMRNGSGDDLFALFNGEGCFVRGFDHESLMSPWCNEHRKVWPGVLEAVSPALSPSLQEPAFHMGDTTFCIWRDANDSAWRRGSVQFPEGEDPDGSGWMLSLICSSAAEYQMFANDYFEVDVSLDAIRRVFAHEPMTEKLLSAFPTKREFGDLLADASEIGYEVAP
jgi:hypothetical protein